MILATLALGSFLWGYTKLKIRFNYGTVNGT
jgi:hypothetical protein